MPDILYGIPPIYGNFEFNQKDATVAPLVIKNTSGTQVFSVSPTGNVNLKRYTTKPTTGLTKGDIFLTFHNSVPRLSACTSTAAQTVRFIRLKTKTNGRLTA